MNTIFYTFKSSDKSHKGLDAYSHYKMKYYYIFFLILISCSKQNNTTTDVFRYNEHKNIGSLDPAFAKDNADIWAVNQLFNGLVQMDEKPKCNSMYC